jgi:hypothetical protein
MQVKVLPDTNEIIPAVLQLDPALTAAFTGNKQANIRSKKLKKKTTILFLLNEICKYLI